MTTPLAGPRSLRDGVLSRWREVEVHHLDLAAGHHVTDWPAAFVDLFLPRTITGLPRRARDIPDGHRWRLHDTSSGTTWCVTALDVTAGDAPADTEAVADAPHLLAWLLGRGTSGVRVTPHDAPDLPACFPFG